MEPNFPIHMLSLRLSVRNSSLPCIGECSRKDAKPLRFRDEIRYLDSDGFFAPLRLSVKESSWNCVEEVSRKDAEPLRFRNGSTCGRIKASSIQHAGSSIASYFGAREATIASKRGSLRSNRS